MNEKIKTGGAAFPVPNDANVNEQEGMTLRDYFAAKAMQSLCSILYGDFKALTQSAYIIADAMLAEQERGDE